MTKQTKEVNEFLTEHQWQIEIPMWYKYEWTYLDLADLTIPTLLTNYSHDFSGMYNAIARIIIYHLGAQQNIPELLTFLSNLENVEAIGTFSSLIKNVNNFWELSFL